MATLTLGRFAASLTLNRGKESPSAAVHRFTQKATQKTKGPTVDLKRVYRAYLENQGKQKTV